MILNNAVFAGYFIYCPAYFSPNESYVYHNKGHGHFHQYSYVVEGRGIISASKELGSEPIYINDSHSPGVLFDHTHLKDTWHSIKTEEVGLSLINFNPVPDTRKLEIEIIHGPKELIVTTQKDRKTILAITGPVSVNDKEVLGLQHVKVLPNKEVKLVLGEKASCAIVK